MNNAPVLRTLLIGWLAISAIISTRAKAGDTGSPQPILQYSIVGSSSCDTKPCYNELMKSVPVQHALLKLANNPAGLSATDAALDAVAKSVPDLLALRLIRREGDRYFLDFPLFTAADEERIRDVSEHYAESLAAALLTRRQEIQALLSRYNAPGVDTRAVAYFLLGCVSLDWDGLDVTAAMGYRKTSDDRPDGKYVPAAEEKSEATLQGIYWGSHNEVYSGIHFTSFGDHYSLPRYMLPDVLWRVPGSPAAYPDPVENALDNLLAQLFSHSGYQLGKMMLTLRDGEKSGAQMAQAAGAGDGEAEALLAVLVALDYVSENDGRYQTRIPILTEQDAAMVASLRALGKQVMEQWLSHNYAKMQDALKGLSFTRSGVPFADGYTMIWHYLFGITNRKLVEAGLFPDPYAKARQYKGAIPAVYTLDLSAP